MPLPLSCSSFSFLVSFFFLISLVFFFVNSFVVCVSMERSPLNKLLELLITHLINSTPSQRLSRNCSYKPVVPNAALFIYFVLFQPRYSNGARESVWPCHLSLSFAGFCTSRSPHDNLHKYKYFFV